MTDSASDRQRLAWCPVAALNSSTTPSGRAPSTAFTPRFVISQTPVWSAVIANGTLVTDEMTRTSAPVAALNSETQPLRCIP